MNNMNNFDNFYQTNEQEYAPHNYTAQPVQKKKTGAGKKLIITALCCSMLGGAFGAGGTYLGLKAMNSSAVSTSSDDNGVTLLKGTSNKEGQSDSASVIKTKTADTSKLMTASEVYKANVNSTVGIRTSISSTNYWGYKTQAAAAGSGFIISEDGYILTNHHVIEDAESITVTMYDGTSYKAKLVGSDESNDIAVLKIDAEGLTPVVLGSSDALEVGDDVVAIGNPLGELTFSLTAGVVSALDRTITTSSTTMDLIQTDCAINSGNSGGALFNMYGEVIGITNAKYSSSSTIEASIDNIGFAIPIDNVISLVDSIISKGYAAAPYIGVSVTDVSTADQEEGLPKGAAVYSVTKNTPAEEAGIEAGDIITKVNGETVSGKSELVAKIKKAKIGEELTLTINRDGKERQVKVTVAEKQQDTEKSTEKSTEKQNGGWYYNGGDDQDPFSQFGGTFPGYSDRYSG